MAKSMSGPDLTSVFRDPLPVAANVGPGRSSISQNPVADIPARVAGVALGHAALRRETPQLRGLVTDVLNDE